MVMLDKIKKIGQRKIVSREGGDKTSAYLRKITLKNNNVDVGMYTYGSCFHDGFNVGGKVVIGRYCSFGPNVHYFGANHPMEYASMSPYFYQKAWGGEKVSDIPRYELEVGHDVWVGYGAIITCNCRKIGTGAIIGAGSIVTKDVEPYTIVVGNPAKVLKKRFDNETIDLLEESKWFLKEPDELLKHYDVIAEPKKFAKAVIDEDSKRD